MVCTFRVSMVEIYNEALRDLLAVAPSEKAQEKDLAKKGQAAGLDIRCGHPAAKKVLCWPRSCKLAHAFLWEHS